ncbi:flagellin [Alphaproteobacteria bacterium]|nr:flagellin [Alphaproteobacteria bacterium]
MSSGDIRSSVPLEYDNQTSFNFEVRYTSVEGKEFVENVNLNITDTLNSTAYLLAEQSQNVVINPSDLSSSKEFAEKYTARGDPGVFSFANTGSDWQKFNINTTTGKITSKQALTIEEQDSYQFNVLYTTNSGTVHNELVNLTLSESLQATSNLTSKEANRVQVNVDELKSLSAFANKDFDRGSYEISGGTHSNAFRFTGRKTIESTQIIEFDERSNYTFDVTYTGSDGRKFTETVNLAIQDTLSSTSTLAIEQSKSAQILAETLVSTQSFANKYELTGPTGQYQILSRSSNLKNATVDNSGNITSNGELLLAEGQTGFLELQYTAWNGQKHVERVNLTVTDSLQGKSEVFAKEANIVGIDAYDLTGIGHFAVQDGSKGQFFLENYQDNNSFNIDNSGFISSKSNIEFDTKSQYEFKVAYRASDGRIYRETVDLFIEDTFKGLSSFSVEESESVEINNTSLTAIYNFATNYNTPSVKGKFELKESNDSKFFSVNEDNGTINSIGELRKSTQDRYNITLIYTAPDGITSFEEDIDLRVLDSTFNRAKSNLTVKESSEVTIKNETNEFINTFAKSDNFQGRFELSSSDPFRQEYKNYEVDEQGNIKSTIDVDFESVALNQDLLLTYYHSDGVQSYRNQIDLKITNDVRDDDSLNLEDVDVGTQEKSKVAFGVLDAAIAKLSEVESNLGAVENRLSHAIDYQTTSSMITESSRGRIMDADFATETASLSKSLILQEAATAMLAQSNRLQSQVLMLLR